MKMLFYGLVGIGSILLIGILLLFWWSILLVGRLILIGLLVSRLWVNYGWNLV